MNSAASILALDSVENVTLRETADPEVIVADYKILGHLPQRKAFALTYVAVTRVQNGLIVSSRDYGNPLSFDGWVEHPRRAPRTATTSSE